jgi:hypothetical protein
MMIVSKTQHLITLLRQLGVATGIVLLLPWIIMRSPVELNDQPMFDAEEIHNVFSDGNLTPELQAHERAATQSAP